MSWVRVLSMSLLFGGCALLNKGEAAAPRYFSLDRGAPERSVRAPEGVAEGPPESEPPRGS